MAPSKDPTRQEIQAAKASQPIHPRKSPYGDVWFGYLGELAVDHRLLDQAEQQRAARYISLAARHQFVCSRAIVREIIGRYVGREPADLVFSAQPGGRPFLKGQQLDFNLSHSGDWLVLAIGQGCRFGVDIESYCPSSPHEAIVGQHFSRAEQEQWRSAAPDGRAKVFARIWTRKEAALKAVGIGIIDDLAMLDTTGETSLCHSLAKLNLGTDWTVNFSQPLKLTLHDLPSPDNYVASMVSIGPIIIPSLYSWHQDMGTSTMPPTPIGPTGFSSR